jgi:hypothetical protein
MGKILCPRHGGTTIDFVSAAVAAAVAAGAPLAVVAVPWELAEHYPPARAWADHATAGSFAGRTLSLDDLEGFVPVCERCLEAWLTWSGADLSRPAEEQRHLDLQRALGPKLRPVLAPALQRVSGSWGVGSRRGAPFVASAGAADQIIVLVSDEGGSLRGTASASIPLASPFPPPVVVPVQDGTLDDAALRALTNWAEQVAQALK